MKDFSYSGQPEHNGYRLYIQKTNRIVFTDYYIYKIFYISHTGNESVAFSGTSNECHTYIIEHFGREFIPNFKILKFNQKVPL